ncbi:hypothetical protein A6C57_00420 [Fibrella sp. ES10-3-2-2]|nr:hypothetical protein A6C57_00420 [Fibrella sp. ES10-3-2-2]
MDKGKLEGYLSEGKSLRKIAVAESVSLATIRHWVGKYGLASAFNPFSKSVTDYKCSCGETDPNKFYGHKKQICSSCQNNYNKIKSKTSKEFAVAYLGGKCAKCGYNRCLAALDIHHKDPTIKDPSFGAAKFWSRARYIKELDGCELLCKNCHAEVHYPNS